jgi:hypothetical protein
VIFSVILAVSAGLAPESLRIATPLSGSSVSGMLLVEGSISGGSPVELTIGLAPQALGDCGSPLVETRFAGTANDFATTLPTTAVPDGTYCLVAVADAGRLSAVVADLAVTNPLVASESLDGLQLPTLSADGEASNTPVEASSGSSGSNPFGAASVLAPAALGATAAISVLVLVVSLWMRQHSAR